jgi:hypothetical protein
MATSASNSPKTAAGARLRSNQGDLREVLGAAGSGARESKE